MLARRLHHPPRRKAFPCILLRTLFRSLRSFSAPRPFFSTTSALFQQSTRGGIPLRKIVRCTEAQKCLSVSPLLATLTHSVSRKSFACHSYANTRDGGATVTPVSAPSSPAPKPATYNCKLRLSKSFRMRSYTKCACKSFRIRSYENTRGGGRTHCSTAISGCERRLFKG